MYMCCECVKHAVETILIEELSTKRSPATAMDQTPIFNPPVSVREAIALVCE